MRDGKAQDTRLRCEYEMRQCTRHKTEKARDKGMERLQESKEEA